MEEFSRWNILIQINSGSHSIAQTGAQKGAANPHKEIEYQFTLDCFFPPDV